MRCEELLSIQERVGKDFLSDHALSLLVNRISKRVAYFILEYPYVDKDFRSTYYSDFSKRHQNINRNSFRIHVFGKNEEYYGFFTLRNTPPFNLGRGYLNPKALAVGPGHFLLTKFDAHILGKTFSVNASHGCSKTQIFQDALKSQYGRLSGITVKDTPFTQNIPYSRSLT